MDAVTDDTSRDDLPARGRLRLKRGAAAVQPEAGRATASVEGKGVRGRALSRMREAPSDNAKLSSSARQKKERIACPQCDKKFSQVGSLQTHMRVHTGDRPYMCKECGKAFTQLGSLQLHSRTHTGERPFACKSCGKKFTQKVSLQIHERTHTGEKPFACGFCDRWFSQRGSLQTHWRTHTGDRPYECTFCTKRFSQRASLHAHMRTHTGERPFRCTCCGESFTQHSSLKMHMLKYHPAAREGSGAAGKGDSAAGECNGADVSPAAVDAQQAAESGSREGGASASVPWNQTGGDCGALPVQDAPGQDPAAAVPGPESAAEQCGLPPGNANTAASTGLNAVLTRVVARGSRRRAVRGSRRSDGRQTADIGNLDASGQVIPSMEATSRADINRGCYEPPGDANCESGRNDEEDDSESCDTTYLCVECGVSYDTLSRLTAHQAAHAAGHETAHDEAPLLHAGDHCILPFNAGCNQAAVSKQ